MVHLPPGCALLFVVHLRVSLPLARVDELRTGDVAGNRVGVEGGGRPAASSHGDHPGSAHELRKHP
jgi:hypothetical protein